MSFSDCYSIDDFDRISSDFISQVYFYRYFGLSRSRIKALFLDAYSITSSPIPFFKYKAFVLAFLNLVYKYDVSVELTDKYIDYSIDDFNQDYDDNQISEIFLEGCFEFSYIVSNYSSLGWSSKRIKDYLIFHSFVDFYPFNHKDFDIFVSLILSMVYKVNKTK
jgi:hypothetical protein